jgi:hypothetical protein
LVTPGQSRATTDQVIAQTLFAKRLAELSDARDNETIVPVKRKPGLAEVIK